MLVSLLLPLSSYSIRLNNVYIETPKTESAIKSDIKNDNVAISPIKEEVSAVYHSPDKPVNYWVIVVWAYWLISAVVFLYFIIGIINIYWHYRQSKKEQIGNVVILRNESLSNSFSFMNLIFLNPNGLSEKETDSIVAHENIHVSQYHTIDLLLIELVAAVMWFNPFVWLFRKSFRQVHEYLADEGVLNIGFDRLEYQALLINQVAQGRLLSLACNFNQSLIKKRIMMMTKIKSGNKAKLKLLAIVPLTLGLFLMIACANGHNINKVTAVETVRMNVLYLGVDNPIKIAASGYDPSELDVTIDNGKIFGKNGQYIVRPEKDGQAWLTVSCKGKVVQLTSFRVKIVPDPAAMIPVQEQSGYLFRMLKSGEISKKELLSATGLMAGMENFDFDIEFKVASFVLSVTVPNSMEVKEEISNSEKFSKGQIDLIKSLVVNQKLTVENITVVGSDGTKRKLSPLVFTIVADK